MAQKRLTRRELLRAAGYGGMAALVPAGVADLSSNCLVLEQHELKVPRWDADGFRVAVLSDLHANEPAMADRASDAVRLAIAQKPDVIVMPGDFINATDKQRMARLRFALEPLREAKCPVVATMGNHDYWTIEPRKVIDTVGQYSRLLRNEAVEVQGVTIAGLDDAIAERQDPRFLEEGRHSKSLLVLFHEPDFVVETPKHVSLQISGHSHGGQICMPNGKPFHTPFGAKKYIAGFYPEANVPLYVTRGVGTVGMDWRLFCLPEVSLLTVVRA